ncbi:hypothetical protein [Arundinibacter roseus]|uniref:Uncharacterized protein n=1 Tax=Arundinibacter roseus TaxID=2070510 RepID=A0A4R4K222_9BACT|nr:hypothetical protein [Arundinibacter roseus]TDB60421.1 hypothetical protein EZE20_21045 [Arundinibacter roseus]
MSKFFMFCLALFAAHSASSQKNPGIWDVYAGKKIKTVSEAERKSEGKNSTTINGVPTTVKATKTTRRTTRQTTFRKLGSADEYQCTFLIQRIQLEATGKAGLQYDSENTFERNPALQEMYDRLDQNIDKPMKKTIHTSPHANTGQAVSPDFLADWVGGLPQTHAAVELSCIFLNSYIFQGARTGAIRKDTLTAEGVRWENTYRMVALENNRWTIAASFVKKDQATKPKTPALSQGVTGSTEDSSFEGQLEVDARTGLIYKAELMRESTTTAQVMGSAMQTLNSSTYRVVNSLQN